MKFDDEFIVFIIEKGIIVIQTKKNIVHTISDVFFVHELKKKIPSTAWLKRKYKIYIKNIVHRIEDDKLDLIAKVKIKTK